MGIYKYTDRQSCPHISNHTHTNRQQTITQTTTHALNCTPIDTHTHMQSYNSTKHTTTSTHTNEPGQEQTITHTSGLATPNKHEAYTGIHTDSPIKHTRTRSDNRAHTWPTNTPTSKLPDSQSHTNTRKLTIKLLCNRHSHLYNRTTIHTYEHLAKHKNTTTREQPNTSTNRQTYKRTQKATHAHNTGTR